MRYSPVFAPAMAAGVLVAACFFHASRAAADDSTAKQPPVRFQTTAEAGTAFDKASGLDAQLALVRPLAVAYIREGIYPALVEKLKTASVPADAEWQRDILVCELCRQTGDFPSAANWLAQIPAAARGDIRVLKYKAAHRDVNDVEPGQLMAAIAKLEPNAETRRDTIEQALDDRDPDKAVAILAANPGDITAAPLKWLGLARKFENAEIAPRLLPLLEKLKTANPDEPQLRMLLAQIQIMAGDKKGVMENLWYVYQWAKAIPGADSNGGSWSDLVDSQSDAFFIQRVHEENQMHGNPYFDTYSDPRRQWQYERVLALAQMSVLAQDLHEEDAFLKRLEPTLPAVDDYANRIAVFMIINAPLRAFREIHAYLDSGASSHTADLLGCGWCLEFQESRENRMALELKRLMPPLERNLKAVKNAEETPVGFDYKKFYAALEEASKTKDSALAQKMIDQIDALAVKETPWAAGFFMLNALHGHPKDEFYRDLTARCMAQCVRVSIGNFSSSFALNHAGSWQVGKLYFWGIAQPPEEKPSVAAQAALTLQIHSTFNAEDGTTDLKERGIEMPERIPAMSPEECAVFDKLGADASSPLKDYALLAKAYFLQFHPAHRDEALRIANEIVTKSPTDYTRLWLAAMLAQHSQYPQAIAQVDAIKTVPGYLAAYIHNARAVLQRASTGQLLTADYPAQYARPEQLEWPDQMAIRPPEPLKRAAPKVASWDIVQEFYKVSQKDPALASKLADQYLKSIRFENEVDRPQFFSAAKSAGLLPGLITKIQAMADANPTNEAFRIALAEARAMDDPEGAVQYYLQALGHFPDNVPIASTILLLPAGNQSGENKSAPPDVMPAFQVVFRHDPYYAVHWAVRAPGGDKLIQRLKESPKLPGYVAAFVASEENLKYDDYNEANAASDSLFVRDVARVFHDAGKDAMLPDLFKTLRVPSTWREDRDEPLIDPVFDTMIQNGMADGAKMVLTHVLLPTPHREGIEMAASRPGIEIGAKPCVALIEKAQELKMIPGLEAAARAAVADDPDYRVGWQVLLAVQAVNGDHADAAEYKRFLGNEDYMSTSYPGANQTLALLAINSPGTREIGYDLQTSAQTDDSETINTDAARRLVQSALDLGETDRAKTALQRLMGFARTRKQNNKQIDQKEWFPCVPLLLRAGMKDEAYELVKIISNPDGNPNYLHAPPMMVVRYMRFAHDYGDVPHARQAIAEFQTLLARDTDPKSREDIEQELPLVFVPLFADLGLADEASQALDKLEGSWAVSNNPYFGKQVAAARVRLAQLTHDAPSNPIAFGTVAKDGKIKLWWDLGMNVKTGIGWEKVVAATTYATNMKALDGRYTVEISGGADENGLVPLAKIEKAPARGEWSGEPAKEAGGISYLQVKLTDANGKSIEGPVMPVCMVENMLADSGFDEAAKAGKMTDAWNFEGAFTKVPGPVPGVEGINYIFPLTRQQSSGDDVEIRGKWIPCEKGDSFYLSGWVRTSMQMFNNVSFRYRFYDEKGKELGTGSCESAVGENGKVLEMGWVFVQRCLLSNDPKGGEEAKIPAEAIPEGTKFIEPFVAFPPDSNDDVPYLTQWAGLVVGKLPQPQMHPPVQPFPGQEEAPMANQTPPVAPPAGHGEIISKWQKILCGKISPVTTYMILPGSKFLVAGCIDGSLVLMEYPSGKEIITMHLSGKSVESLYLLPSTGNVVAVDKVGGVHFISFKPVPGARTIFQSDFHTLFGSIMTPDAKAIVIAAVETPESYKEGLPKCRLLVVDPVTGNKLQDIPFYGWPHHMWIDESGEKLFANKNGALNAVWRLSDFQQLPDVAASSPTPHDPDNDRESVKNQPPAREDEKRGWRVLFDDRGRLVVQGLNNPGQMIWSFGGLSEPASRMEIVPADGGILVLQKNGMLQLFEVPPEAPAPTQPVRY